MSLGAEVSDHPTRSSMQKTPLYLIYWRGRVVFHFFYFQKKIGFIDGELVTIYTFDKMLSLPGAANNSSDPSGLIKTRFCLNTRQLSAKGKRLTNPIF